MSRIQTRLARALVGDADTKQLAKYQTAIDSAQAVVESSQLDVDEVTQLLHSSKATQDDLDAAIAAKLKAAARLAEAHDQLQRFKTRDKAAIAARVHADQKASGEQGMAILAGDLMDAAADVQSCINAMANITLRYIELTNQAQHHLAQAGLSGEVRHELLDDRAVGATLAKALLHSGLSALPFIKVSAVRDDRTLTEMQQSRNAKIKAHLDRMIGANE